MTTSGEVRLDMDRIREALAKARMCMEGLDKADALRNDAPHQSALRTLIEHAERAADRVMEFIGDQAAGREPGHETPGHDGGPL